MTETTVATDASSSVTTPKSEPDKPKLTVRSAASIALVVVGGVAAIGLLAAGGWIAAAAVPVAAGTGLYTRHRMKNPKRTTRTTKGKLTWPLTGNQSRRALLPRGNGGSGKRSGTGRTGSRGTSRSTGRKGSSRTGGRAGFHLPKTTRSRARAGAGGALPKHKASRPVARRTTGTPSAGGRNSHSRPTGSSKSKPLGTRTPKTPSRTPARPNRRPAGLTKSSKRPTTAHRKSPTRGTSSGLRRGGHPTTPGLFKSRRGTSGKTGGTGTRTRQRPASKNHPSKGGSRSKLFRPGSLGSSIRRSRGTASRPGRTMRQRLNPFKRTSPSGKHSTTRNPYKRTKPKMRTGNPDRMKRRDQVPRRTPSRPKPYRRAPARSLWRLALGVPVRDRKNRLSRPTTAQRRRARRTLRLRALAHLWALRKLPGRASRWHWDRIFRRVPGSVDPRWAVPTIEPEPPTPPTSPAGPGLAKVIPLRKDTPIMADGPHESIAEAFNQLAQFEPQTAGDWERFLASQHELFLGMGQAYQALADRARGGHAFNAQTAEQLQDLAAAVGSLAGMAEGAHQAFGHGQ